MVDGDFIFTILQKTNARLGSTNFFSEMKTVSTNGRTESSDDQPNFGARPFNGMVLLSGQFLFKGPY